MVVTKYLNRFKNDTQVFTQKLKGKTLRFTTDVIQSDELKEFLPLPFNRNLAAKNYNGLLESIENEGFLGAIEVVITNKYSADGSYEPIVVNGHHRAFALGMIEKSIPIQLFIIDDTSDFNWEGRLNAIYTSKRLNCNLEKWGPKDHINAFATEIEDYKILKERNKEYKNWKREMSKSFENVNVSSATNLLSFMNQDNKTSARAASKDIENGVFKINDRSKMQKTQDFMESILPKINEYNDGRKKSRFNLSTGLIEFMHGTLNSMTTDFTEFSDENKLRQFIFDCKEKIALSRKYESILESYLMK